MWGSEGHLLGPHPLGGEALPHCLLPRGTVAASGTALARDKGTESEVGLGRRIQRRQVRGKRWERPGACRWAPGEAELRFARPADGVQGGRVRLGLGLR